MLIYKDSPAPLPVTKTAFTSPLSETSLESAAPPDEGGARLRDVLLAHPDLGPVVQQNGIPDAITLNQGENSPPVLAFFYLNPPRTLLFAPSLWSREFGEPNEIKEIPRSVRRLTFEQGPMPPPWPVGTLFVSDGLITMLSDDELVAIIAHLLGHEAYGHGRSWYLEAGPVKRIAARVAVTAGTVLFGVGVLGCGGGSGGACEEGLNVAVAGVKVATADFAPAQEFSSYSHDEEVQANSMAARYLTAVGIPPDALFDALAKVASATVSSEIPANDKSSIHDFVEVRFEFVLLSIMGVRCECTICAANSNQIQLSGLDAVDDAKNVT
jgi:Zn-dependent protease with chaperone function